MAGALARPNGNNNAAKIERSFRTKREAEDWLALQRTLVLDGTHIDPRRAERPFATAVEAWRESWGPRLSPTTARRYDSILNTHLLPEFGRTPLAEITRERVQRYVNKLANDPTLAAGTVRNVYAVLRTALASAVRLGTLKTNPCAEIDLPRALRQEMLFLSVDEVRAVAEAIDPHYRVLVYAAAYTGLRAGELAGMRTRARGSRLRRAIERRQRRSAPDRPR